MNKENKMKYDSRTVVFLRNYCSIFRSSIQERIAVNAIERFILLDRANGRSTAIQSSKSVYLFLKRKFLEQDADLVHKPLWIKTNKDGIPKYLLKGIRYSEFNRLITHCKGQQAVLTACYYYTMYNGPIDIDSSSITDESSADASAYSFLLEEIENFSRRWFMRRKVPTFKPSDESPVYGTTKASASGHHALDVSSLLDILSLKESGLFDIFQRLTPLFYQEDQSIRLINLMDNSFQRAKDMGLDCKGITARLHRISEGGGKTRTICIPDIWTQCTLKSVHSYFMSILKNNIPFDGTFDHNLAAKLACERTSSSPLYCFDLTAVTDRLPVDLQEKVFKYLLGEERSKAWRTILTDRDIDDNGKRIRYSVGQPMGMLSSWPAMAITHHMIINYCKWKVGVSQSSFHMIIGDDIVISSKKAAEKYKSVIESLGIGISKDKSILPVHGYAGEMAKRIFIGGHEISPIPPLILTDASKDLLGFCQFLRIFTARTSNHGGYSELEKSQIFSRIFEYKIKNDSLAHIVLSCPVKDRIIDLPGLPSITGVRSAWTGGQEIQKVVSNDFDRFINESATKTITDLAIKYKFIDINTGQLKFSNKFLNVRGYEEGELSPLMIGFYEDQKSTLVKLLKVQLFTYGSEEDDEFSLTPEETLAKILSQPDPFDLQDYRKKAEIRELKAFEMIQKYWNTSRFKNRTFSIS